MELFGSCFWCSIQKRQLIRNENQFIQTIKNIFWNRIMLALCWFTKAPSSLKSSFSSITWSDVSQLLHFTAWKRFEATFPNMFVHCRWQCMLFWREIDNWQLVLICLPGRLEWTINLCWSEPRDCFFWRRMWKYKHTWSLYVADWKIYWLDRKNHFQWHRSTKQSRAFC